MKTYNPVFIIGSYRGGTSLLFRLLSESDDLWSLYRESDFMWQQFFRHHDEKADTVIFEKLEDGNFKNLTKSSWPVNPKDMRKVFDKRYDVCAYPNYAWGYLSRIRFLREKMPWLFNFMNSINYVWKVLFVGSYRFIDKTPPNAYRINFINAMYPDAKFIYLVRNREANIKSLISAWTHKSKFQFLYRKYLTTSLNIKDYAGKLWKFFITPGFENYTEGKSLREVCEFQYDDVHEHIQKSLAELDSAKYIKVNFEEFLASPDIEMKKICDFVEVDYSSKMQKLVHNMPEVNKS